MNKFSPKNVLNLLISHHWNGLERIDSLLITVFYNNFEKYDLELACEKYCDINTSQFKRLINCIESVNRENSFKKIEIIEEYDGFYVEKVSNDILVTEKYKEVCSIFDKIESLTMNSRGTYYEKFCKLFISDLGIDTEVTRASNDKGIDVLGKYKANFPKGLTQLVFSDEIYLLIQTKFYNKPIDTPVIRKLVGDSLFIRFDELEYINIRHNAFHLIVFSHKGFTEPAKDFAKRNKVMTFDSIQVAHIISEEPNNNWKCLSVLD